MADFKNLQHHTGLLRQRFPFLMIDRITAFEPGREITGTKAFFNSDPLLGVIPGNIPLFLFIETLGQLSEILIRASYPGIPKTGILAAVNGFEVRGEIFPNYEITIKSRLGNQFRNYYETCVTAFIDEEQIIKGALTHAFK